jgi:hypothetical protein
MANNTFARSGTADTDLLADDDPLSELARIVGYEPRLAVEPRPDVRAVQPVYEPAPVVARRQEPVFGLEDELMREFELYDAPNLDPVDHVSAPETGQDVAFDDVEIEAVVEREREVEPVVAPDPVPEAGSFVEAPEYAFEETLSADDDAVLVEPEPVVVASEVDFQSPVFDGVVAGDDAPLLQAEPVVAYEDSAAEPYLAVEPEQSLAATVEEPIEEHVYYEPVEWAPEPARMAEEPVSRTVEPSFEAAVERHPVFLGLQPTDLHDDPLADSGADSGLDLERELELSISDGLFDVAPAVETAPAWSDATAGDFVRDAVVSEAPEVSFDLPDLDLELALEAEAAFVAAQPVSAASVDSRVEPALENWTGNIEAGAIEPEPFHAEVAYGDMEPRFVAELPFEQPEEHARIIAAAEAQWDASGNGAFQPEPAYAVTGVEKGDRYDIDDLLAEVERYPVPEARSPLLGEVATVAAAVTPPRAGSGLSTVFGRATPVIPVVQRDPVVDRIETAPIETGHFEPAFEARSTPVTDAEAVAPFSAEPDVDFENFELDLSDIELDPLDFAIEEAPVKQEPVVATRHEPAVAVPVSTFTASRATPAFAPETADGSLPFDPKMIADIEESVAPVTDLAVPQLPVVEKEKPPVQQPDYDLDIDAEMAQLFSDRPASGSVAGELPAGVSAGVAAASLETPYNEPDDFEKALEEDFRRSLNQPERRAIPVDSSQPGLVYSTDGYDEEQPGRRRGLLIAASIATLLVLGGGGVYAWMSAGGGAVGSGEPRVILADKDPIKVVPEEKGGKTVPNQDKAVYDRVAGNTDATTQQEQLVTTTEEPIDVVQRTLTPETLPFDGPNEGEPETIAEAEAAGRLLPGVDEPDTTAGGEDGKPPLISPRKVKTMIVKPDGTLVAREETVTEPETEVAAAGPITDVAAEAAATTAGTIAEAVTTATAAGGADAEASLRNEQAAGETRSALADVAEAEVEDTAPVRVVRTTTIGAAATTDAATETAAGTDSNMPVPETRPIDQPVTVVGTVTDQGNLSVPRTTETATATQTTGTTAEATQVATANAGGYVIQIASLPSEAEAQKTYNSLSSKFSGVIGGRGVDIRRAEIANKGTFFRVRIPAGSREEANSLCTRYKSAGGSCLVTR